jgi:hypothetical protein
MVFTVSTYSVDIHARVSSVFLAAARLRRVSLAADAAILSGRFCLFVSGSPGVGWFGPGERPGADAADMPVEIPDLSNPSPRRWNAAEPVRRLTTSL